MFAAFAGGNPRALFDVIAEDWTNVDLLSAHRAARDDLAALLARWERLFEEAGARPVDRS